MDPTIPPVRGPMTTSLSEAEIAQVVAELAPRLSGAFVGKVHDAPGPTLLVEIGPHRLILSAHPRASRLHLERTGPATFAPTPPVASRTVASARERPTAAPSGFAMLLRKRLGGRRLAALSVVAPDERVVALDFGPGRDRLVAELTGPHANVFLVDADGRIVASLRPTGSTTRPLAPGDVYSLPHPAPPHARWRGLRRFGESPGVAERVAEHYERALREAAVVELRERAAVALRRAIDRLHRREQALLVDRARAEEAQSFRKYGDLLLAHLREMPGRGAAEVTVPDAFADGQPLRISLDPLLDARQNAERYYRQYRRFYAALRGIDERLAATRAARAAKEAQLAALPTLDLHTVATLAARAPGSLSRRARAREEAPRLPYREYVSADGTPIWVGRSAADNDELTFRHARGNDLWLHARDCAGPHVIVPLRQRRPVSEATLLDAATLAAHFSPLGREAQVDVSYTYVKNLRRPRNAPAGAVYVSDAKTVRVRLDPARIERLLLPSTEEDPV